MAFAVTVFLPGLLSVTFLVSCVAFLVTDAVVSPACPVVLACVVAYELTGG